MLTGKITLPDSPYPIIISKILVKIQDFGRFISLDGMNFCLFRLIKFFFILAAG